MLQNQGSLFGLKLFVNPLACTTTSVKVHRKGSYSKTYHRRIQKKWDKRFGMKTVPSAYVLNTPLFGQQLVVHPQIYQKLKEGIPLDKLVKPL